MEVALQDRIHHFFKDVGMTEESARRLIERIR